MYTDRHEKAQYRLHKHISTSTQISTLAAYHFPCVHCEICPTMRPMYCWINDSV